MDELPKIPGLYFEDRFKTNYNVPRSFEIINGYNFIMPVKKTIGNTSLVPDKSVAFIDKTDSAMFDPALTYGCVKRPHIEPFRPKFVVFDRMVLTFKGFFKQGVPDSEIEYFRIRHVNILYFLEDDSIKVVEPGVKNSGMSHGLLVRRSKVAKNVKGEVYTWKDFNIGIDIEINGIVFHITDCDQFTKDFLISQGVELNDTEVSPVDPVTCEKTINRLNSVLKSSSSKTTSREDDKLRRFLEFQGKILKFECVLDETSRPYGEVRNYEILYFLEDDTVLIKISSNDKYAGKSTDRNIIMLKRTRLPKNWKKRPTTFPSIYMETSEEEVEEYYQPKDFIVGETIFVFGRKFLLLDCDKFTRKYYEDVLKIKQGNRLSVECVPKPQRIRNIPEYIGLGTPEDSLASFYQLRPSPPKTDVVKYITNAGKYLRYGCILDSVRPEDKTRKFIISYSLADDKISIMEPPLRNSGIIGGKFLNAQRVVLPDCDKNNPSYYEPKHFYIGAILTINYHRFKVVNADYFVYKYMKEHPELFSPNAFKDVQKCLLLEGNLKDEIRNEIIKDVHEEEQQIKSKEDQQTIEGRYDHYDHEDTQLVSAEEMEKCLRDVNVHQEEKSQDEGDTLATDKSDHLTQYKPVSDPLKCPYKVQPNITTKGMLEGYQLPSVTTKIDKEFNARRKM